MRWMARTLVATVFAHQWQAVGGKLPESDVCESVGAHVMKHESGIQSTVL